MKMITKASTKDQFQEITLIPFRLGFNQVKGLCLKTAKQGDFKVHSGQKLILESEIQKSGKSQILTLDFAKPALAIFKISGRRFWDLTREIEKNFKIFRENSGE